MDRKKKAVLLFTVSLLLLFAVIACATQQVAPTAQQPVQTVKAAEAPPPPAPAKPKSMYDAEIKPLTTEECARCHFSIFTQIKNEGGKHKIDCTQCHTVYHAYNPIRQNWAQIMPKCQTCHGNIHGEKFTACSQCHSNPHAPATQMAMTPEFAKVCGDCHAKVGDELKANPSKHTKVACAQCHAQKHGYIPACMQCHKPHTQGQTNAECLACHPAHNPLKIEYPETTKNPVCGGCHTDVNKKIETTASKHGQVACAKCHPKHKYIPTCEECHGRPHGEVVLKKFPNCLQCHADVHDLPTRAK